VKVGEKTPTQLGPLERANLNPWIQRNVEFFGIQDDGKGPEKFCDFCTTTNTFTKEETETEITSGITTINLKHYRVHRETGYRE
jgi:hypothetical protein